MNWLEYVIAVIALFGLACVSWWGVYQSPHKAANLQMALEQTANAALEAEGMAWADVKMHGQYAILTGQAPSREAVKAAAETVLGSSGQGGVLLGGITQVENAATIAPPRPDFTWTVTKAPDGRLQLAGDVPSQAIAQRLAETARRTGGASISVEDRMTVAGGAPGHNWLGTAKFAIGLLAGLEEGEVRLTGTRLVLIGQTSDPEVRRQVIQQVGALVAPYTGSAIIRGTVVWSAQSLPGQLTLQGEVSSEAVRENFKAIAARHFPGEIIDAQTVGASYMSGADTQRLAAALEQFAGLPEGRLTFDEYGLAVTARALPEQVGVAGDALAGILGQKRVILEIVPPAQP